MYFVGYLQQMLPEIIQPLDVALSLFEQNLQRMLLMRGKTDSLPELAGYIETLQAFHKSIDGLKYRIFEQADADAENVTKVTKYAVAVGVAKAKSIPQMEKSLSEAEKCVVRDVKGFFDLRIKRAETMLKIAKDLQKYFGK